MERVRKRLIRCFAVIVFPIESSLSLEMAPLKQVIKSRLPEATVETQSKMSGFGID